MSIPRMSAARSAASCGSCASLTPPALPRPPVFTCAFTTTTESGEPPPSFSAAARASSGVVATCASSTGTPCAANRSRAWYSKRSTTDVLIIVATGRRMPTTNPSPRPFRPPPSHGLADVRAHPVDDRLHRRARGEDLPDAEALELVDVRLGDDPAAEHHDVLGAALAQELDDAGEERHVGAGEHGETDGVRVLLQGGLDDLLRRLVQAGVDDLHPGVTQGAGDDLGPPVVPVESRLGDDDPQRHGDLPGRRD